MKISAACFLVLLITVSMHLPAEEKSQQSQLDEVQGQIVTQTEVNQKLKDDLGAKDKEIADLRQKLKELEEQTKK